VVNDQCDAQTSQAEVKQINNSFYLLFEIQMVKSKHAEKFHN